MRRAASLVQLHSIDNMIASLEEMAHHADVQARRQRSKRAAPQLTGRARQLRSKP
jgi:molybdenum-dependent DNA-binding transcriptional regulator ModE